MLTGAAHADAAQITAPAAPHTLPSVPGAPQAASPGSGPAGSAPAIKRPALALLARPDTPARAGAGAGIQSTAASLTDASLTGASLTGASLTGGALTGGGLAGGAQAAGTLTSAVSGASGAAVSLASAPVRSLTPALSGLNVSGAAGQVAAINDVLGSAAAPALQATEPGQPAGPDAAAPAGPAQRPGPGTHASQRRAAARFPRPGSGWTGPAAGRPAVRHARRHGAPPSSSDHRGSRGSLPGSRVGLAAGTQTDPAPSGGSAGAAQVAAQLPSSAGTRDLVGNIIRIRVSRRPAGRVAADDPAVSPD